MSSNSRRIWKLRAARRELSPAANDCDHDRRDKTVASFLKLPSPAKSQLYETTYEMPKSVAL